MTPGPDAAGMDVTTALTRVDWVLARYAGCGSIVLRAMSAVDLDAVKVLADAARSHAPALAAIDEVLELADGWEENSAHVPLIDREAAALAVKGAIRANFPERLTPEDDRIAAQDREA